MGVGILNLSGDNGHNNGDKDNNSNNDNNDDNNNNTTLTLYHIAPRVSPRYPLPEITPECGYEIVVLDDADEGDEGASSNATSANGNDSVGIDQGYQDHEHQVMSDVATQINNIKYQQEHQEQHEQQKKKIKLIFTSILGPNDVLSTWADEPNFVRIARLRCIIAPHHQLNLTAFNNIKISLINTNETKTIPTTTPTPTTNNEYILYTATSTPPQQPLINHVIPHRAENFRLQVNYHNQNNQTLSTFIVGDEVLLKYTHTFRAQPGLVESPCLYPGDGLLITTNMTCFSSLYKCAITTAGAPATAIRTDYFSYTTLNSTYDQVEVIHGDEVVVEMRQTHLGVTFNHKEALCGWDLERFFAPAFTLTCYATVLPTAVGEQCKTMPMLYKAVLDPTTTTTTAIATTAITQTTITTTPVHHDDLPFPAKFSTIFTPAALHIAQNLPALPGVAVEYGWACTAGPLSPWQRCDDPTYIATLHSQVCRDLSWTCTYPRTPRCAALGMRGVVYVAFDAVEKCGGRYTGEEFAPIVVNQRENCEQCRFASNRFRFWHKTCNTLPSIETFKYTARRTVQTSQGDEKGAVVVDYTDIIDFFLYYRGSPYPHIHLYARSATAFAPFKHLQIATFSPGWWMGS